MQAHQITNLLAAPLVAGVIAGSIPQPILLALSCPDAATANLDFVLPADMGLTIIDAWAVKTGGAGGAANTVQVQTGASAVIASEMDLNIADAVIARALTIDDATAVIAAGGTIRLDRVKAGGNAACIVYVLGYRHV